MKHSIAAIILAGLLAVAPLGAAAASSARDWEPLKKERTDTRQVAKDTDVEIQTGRSTIVVTTNKQVTIKVFTILGQLVSSDTLPPGTHQLKVSSHGVYIVKAGDITCKVVL